MFRTRGVGYAMIVVMNAFVKQFRSGELVLSDFEGWTDEINKEFEQNDFNGNVGTKLLLEDDRVRVWEIRLAPGERLPPHRHVLDYFWTAVTPGRFLQGRSGRWESNPHSQLGRLELYH